MSSLPLSSSRVSDTLALSGHITGSLLSNKIVLIIVAFLLDATEFLLGGLEVVAFSLDEI